MAPHLADTMSDTMNNEVKQHLIEYRLELEPLSLSDLEWKCHVAFGSCLPTCPPKKPNLIERLVLKRQDEMERALQAVENQSL